MEEHSPENQNFLRGYVAEAMRSERSRANAFYADGAKQVVESYAEQAKQQQMPPDPVLHAKLRLGMDWILARRTVLTELGRMMESKAHPTEQDKERLGATVSHIAYRHDKLTAKAAVAYIRGKRMGETKRRDRIAALHHDLNKIINEHRQRYPESTWDDVQSALGYTIRQVSQKS